MASASVTMGRSGMRSRILPETFAGIAAERIFHAVVVARQQRRILSRLGLPGVGELRVVARELAVVQLRRELDRPLGVARHRHAEVRHVGRARRNQPHIQHAARLPGIALVDRVAVAIQLVGAVEVRARLHRTLAVLGHAAAPEDDAPVGILGLQFQPDIERVHRAAREEVPDLARAHHHIHARRAARLRARCPPRRAGPRPCRPRGSPPRRSAPPLRPPRRWTSPARSRVRRCIAVWPGCRRPATRRRYPR